MKKLYLILTLSLFFTTSPAQVSLSFSKFDDFEKAFLSDDSTVYVFNFWATWCAPCIKELPYFEQLHKENKNVKVVLVSLDSPKDFLKLNSFIQKKKITAQVVALFDKNYNSWLNKIDSDWSGAIPATLIFRGKNRSFVERDFESYKELSSFTDVFTNQLKQ